MADTSPLDPGAAWSAAGTSTPDGLARPVDPDARDAAGLDLAVVLGGGGLFLVAWHVAYLHELKTHGVDLQRPDRLIGTSAGSVMAMGLAGGKLGRLHRAIDLLDERPGIIAKLAPAAQFTPSQDRARALFWFMEDAAPATVREIGHAALAARTPSADTTARTMGLLLGMRRWPSANLHITCVDTYTGERCVITQAAGVSPARAVAASSAVPGIFAPQPVGDRRCMDGGVAGSGIHADLVAGAERAVVLALPDVVPEGTSAESAAVFSNADALAALAAAGTKVFHRTPERCDPERLMDPDLVADAFAMGHRQAREDAEELRAFLA